MTAYENKYGFSIVQLTTNTMTQPTSANGQIIAVCISGIILRSDNHFKNPFDFQNHGFTKQTSPWHLRQQKNPLNARHPFPHTFEDLRTFTQHFVRSCVLVNGKMIVDCIKIIISNSADNVLFYRQSTVRGSMELSPCLEVPLQLLSSMTNRMIIASKSIWNPCMDQKSLLPYKGTCKSLHDNSLTRQ